MVTRIPLAFFVGLVVETLTVLMTAYDGFFSILWILIVVCSGMLLVGVLGSPLLITPVWRAWTKCFWLSVLIAFAGLVLFTAAWHPSVSNSIYVDDLEDVVEMPNAMLHIAGLICLMFGVLFCPFIGLFGDRRWM